VFTIGVWTVFSPDTKLEEHNSSLSKASSEPMPMPMPMPKPVQSLDKVPQVLANVEDKPDEVAMNHDNIEPDSVGQDTARVSARDANNETVDVTVPIPALPDQYQLSEVNLDSYQTDEQNDQDSRENLVATLEQQFSDEPYDNVWSSATEQELMNSFYEAKLEGTQLSEAKCRTTFCRIDVNHADPEAEQRFLAAFAASGKFVNDDKGGFYHHVKDPNGGTRTVFFYARKGHQLPVGSM
jgi:hypothetical protein